MAVATIATHFSCTAMVPGLKFRCASDWLLSLDMWVGGILVNHSFVWMAQFGVAYGVRTGIHVGVDLVNKLKDKPRAMDSAGSGCGVVLPEHQSFWRDIRLG